MQYKYQRAEETPHESLRAPYTPPTAELLCMDAMRSVLQETSIIDLELEEIDDLGDY